jgi:hypothetical protein
MRARFIRGEFPRHPTPALRGGRSHVRGDPAAGTSDPETGEGDGVYIEAETADNDEAWVCYIAGFKR